MLLEEGIFDPTFAICTIDLNSYCCGFLHLAIQKRSACSACVTSIFQPAFQLLVSQDPPEDRSRLRRQSIVIPSTSVDKCVLPTFVYHHCTIVECSSNVFILRNELCDRDARRDRSLAGCGLEDSCGAVVVFLLCNVCCAEVG